MSSIEPTTRSYLGRAGADGRMAAAAVGWLLPALWALPGAAQIAASPTEGVRMPIEASAVPDGARGLEFNPAGLGFIDGYDIQLQFTHLQRGELGGGVAALTGWRLFGPLRFGVGGQYLRDGQGKVGFGVALSPSDTFSIGYSYHGFITSGDDPYRNVSAMDLGMVIRPAQWVSVSANVRDLNAPRIGEVEVERTYEMGLAFRPGTWRLTMAADLAVGERSGNLSPRAAIFGTPWDGVHLGVQSAFHPRGGELGVDLTASVGVDWSVLSGEVGVFAGQVPGGDFDYQGISVGVRLTNQARLSVHRPSGTWVEVALSTPSERPTTSFLGPGGPTQLGTLEYLAQLARDERIAGVLLRYRRYRVSWAQAEELRDAIAALQAAGKKVAVHFDVTDTAGYYAACAADWVLVDPAGGVWLLGVASKVTYFADFFSWIGVKAQFLRYGKYKSYPEAFTESQPTEASREVREALLDGISEAIIDAIARGRGVAEGAARGLFEGGPYTAADAVEAGLVDSLAPSLKVDDALGELAEQRVVLRRGYRTDNENWHEWGDMSRVAVITVDGSIVEGKSSPVSLLGGPSIGDESFGQLVDAAVSNPRVTAIVVRIASPGGSAIASDKMYRKLLEAREKKPVIASMGAVAASGGYYVAAGAERIFAEPSTITGSIGTFLGKFSLGELMGKLQLHTEIWKRGPNADLFFMETEWTPAQLADLERGLRYFYDAFVAVVSEARGMDTEQVERVAQGRVWLGRQALDAGLVDELGGLRVAVAHAARRGGIDPERPIPLLHLPQRSPIDALRDALLPSVRAYSEVGARAPADPTEVTAEVSLSRWLRGEGAFASAEEEAAATDPLRTAIAHALGGAEVLLPFAGGEPLYMLPFVLQWSSGFGASGR